MHKWTEEQYQYLADNVKGTPYKELTERFNAKYGTDFKVSTLSAALGRRNLTNGISANFSKGHQPHNKGIKGWQAGGNSRNTQFKKGRVSENYKPVGSERVDSKDGYTYIKVADPSAWELKHRHIWLQSGREIPEGHTILFADGDRTNITLDNLMLVSREQLAVLNKGGLLQKDKSLNEVAINIANLTMKVTESKKEAVAMIPILDEINKMLGIKDSYKAPDRLMEILYGDIQERNKVFNQMAELFDNNWDFDWFHEYFQNEHADRKQKKQDFTPESVSKVLNQLTGDVPVGTRLDVAAGTGGLTITRWAQDKHHYNPFTYRPSYFFYQAEDLSDRSIPFLLFNLIIRGMNGVVIHGDSITREAYGAWFIQNDEDSYFDYSSMNLLPYNENTEHMLNVKFTEKRYDDIRQSELPTQRLIDYDGWLKQLESDEAINDVLMGEMELKRKENKQLELF